MVVLPEALPSFSLIGNRRIFVNFTDTQDNRHHQNSFTSGFENAMQLAEGFSVVRNVLQNVGADKEIKLAFRVDLQIADIHGVIDIGCEGVCGAVGNVLKGKRDLSSNEIGQWRRGGKIHNPDYPVGLNLLDEKFDIRSIQSISIARLTVGA